MTLLAALLACSDGFDAVDGPRHPHPHRGDDTATDARDSGDPGDSGGTGDSGGPEDSGDTGDSGAPGDSGDSGGDATPDLCAEFPTVLAVDLPWGNGGTVQTRDYAGGFAALGAVAGRVQVPADVPDSGGSPGAVYVAEYDGPPTTRTVTLSHWPCDFRPVDRTGATGPVTIGYGNTAAVYFTVVTPSGTYPALQPGETWYVNVRNRTYEGMDSCGIDACNAIISVDPP